jgi:molybdenum cofactor biosynthesis protein B
MANEFQSPSAAEHRSKSPARVHCAVITVSDTRTVESDSSGQTIVEMLEKADLLVSERAIVPDDPAAIVKLVVRLVKADGVQAILVTGGTGVSPRDQTVEAVAPLLTKELPGYGELLRMLSYQEIGAAAMLSRAVRGLVRATVLLTMPGSTAALRPAKEKDHRPEMHHLGTLAGS